MYTNNEKNAYNGSCVTFTFCIVTLKLFKVIIAPKDVLLDMSLLF